MQDDEGFTSEHVCVVADIAYPHLELILRLTVWAYPNASGIRTQLWISRSGSGMILKMATDQRTPPDARVERVPAGEKPFRRRLFGYYNNTQNRNDTHLDILKEEVLSHPLVGRESYDWASVLCIEDNAGGLALLKESYKCVNQRGHATGGFLCDEREGISCTGWGLHADEISFEEFVPAWATWILAWSGGDLDREVAFKTFDRLRYPIDPKRDVYIQANTWGSTDNSRDARRAACQDSVLQELETCADLGIDVLQIDDGWQAPSGHSTWEPGGGAWLASAPGELP